MLCKGSSSPVNFTTIREKSWHGGKISIKQPHQTTEKLKPKTAKTSFGVTVEKDVSHIQISCVPRADIVN